MTSLKNLQTVSARGWGSRVGVGVGGGWWGGRGGCDEGVGDMDRTT